MKRTIFRCFAALGLLLGTASAQTISTTIQIPDYIKYRQLCRHASAFQSIAAERLRAAKPDSAYRNFFKERFGFSDAEDAIFQSIAAECGAEMTALDAESHTAMLAFRQQYPAGLLHGQPIPALPPELEAIEAKRRAVALHMRDRLQTELSPGGYIRLNSFFAQASRVEAEHVTH